MNCPHFVEGKHPLCGAVDCLFHPSILEERLFCRSSHFHKCGIYLYYENHREKVSQSQYLSEIQAQQFQASEAYL